MHDCEAELMIGQKGAQLAYTETALNKVFYKIDIKGISCLYVFPSQSEASDFSTSRFDPALEMSAHLRDLFSDVKNMGHKRAGNSNLFVRGSRSRSQLKSLPVGCIIFDEVDEMVQENIVLAMERMSGQMQKQAFLLSTPTIDNFGINEWFRKSTQNFFSFKCPSCAKHTEFVFPDCLVIVGEDWSDPRTRESHLICKECKNVLPHKGKFEYLDSGIWIPRNPGSDIEGFHVNQLYSSTVTPKDLAIAYLRSLTNPTDEQEFYNSKLGLTHEIEGARILDSDIEACTGSHKKVKQQAPGRLVTMGVDVGKKLHYEIDEHFLDGVGSSDVNLLATSRLLAEGTVDHFEQLDHLMKDYSVAFCVIDANPERRKALEFAQRWYGRVRLCFYANNITGKNINLHAQEEHTMSVDRTSWLDLALSRFQRQTIVLPIDLSEQYKKHIKALVRVYKKDGNGNPVGKYVHGHEDDHFAHARNYSELALQLAATVGRSYNISGIL